MVDQAKMSNGSDGRGNAGSSWTFTSTRTAARNMAHLLHDAVTLAQLQLKLFLLDCQQLRARVGTPIIAIGVGVVFALASIPVALAGVAFILRDLVGLSWLGAVWVTFGLSLLVAVVCVGCGVWWLKSATNLFESSRVEFTQNIERLKEMLWRSSHPTQSAGQADDVYASQKDFHR
jgi:hypothetical protein